MVLTSSQRASAGRQAAGWRGVLGWVGGVYGWVGVGEQSKATNRYINLDRDEKFPLGDNKMYMLLDQLQHRAMK